MPVSKVLSFSIAGVDAFPVTAEVDIRKGIPAYSTVGLPDKAVTESRNRITAAIKNSGFEFPAKKITVNLAPADIKKEGSAFDFPIALGILASLGLVKKSSLEETGFVGELSLDGSLRRIPGALPIACRMKSMGLRRLILPEQNSREAAAVDGVDVLPVASLKEAVEYLNGRINISPLSVDLEEEFNKKKTYDTDFSDVKGQYFARRAFEVAAAGGHNILMCGPPGAGKTMLARRLITILPPLTVDEAVEVTMIHSVAGGLGPGEALCSARPFRSPHHTASDVALVGGGSVPRPGEITLAHRGVLFLDEFPEFRRKVIEVIRQPLEDGHVTVSRAQETVSYPARFMLVAAMNPCPCGFDGVPGRRCLCTPYQVLRYRAKISGPILDRIDMHIEVPPVERQEIEAMKPGECSDSIRMRVTAAREAQNRRYRALSGVYSNSDLRGNEVERYCVPSAEASELLSSALEHYALSVRGYSRVLKLARTIADIEGSVEIQKAHAAEALQYRVSEGTPAG